MAVLGCGRLAADKGADLPEFGEEAYFEGGAEEGDSGRASGAGFEADDAFYGEDVSVSPEGELLFDVEEFFSHFVGFPMGARVVVDGLEDLGDLIGGGVGLGEVSFEVGCGDGVGLSVEVAEELVIEAGGLEEFLESLRGFGPVSEDGDGLGVFVSEEEFDGPVLVGLESAGSSEDVSELGVFGGSEGFEDGPLFEEHALDVFDSGEDFEGGGKFVGLDVSDGGLEFVDDEFHPEFGGLVLDDEEEFVVVFWVGEGFLGLEELVELEV